MQLIIKNMVCPRCIWAVEDLMQQMHIAYNEVQLGKVDLEEDLSSDQKLGLNDRLKGLGFEIIEAKEEQLVNRVEMLLIDYLSSSEGSQTLSQFLADELHMSYAHLSRLFSQVKGISIEKYYGNLRIEKAKELLYYGELDNAGVAYQLGFSSPAHFSGSFKKSTGYTPTEFKSLRTNSKGLVS